MNLSRPQRGRWRVVLEVETRFGGTWGRSIGWNAYWTRAGAVRAMLRIPVVIGMDKRFERNVGKPTIKGAPNYPVPPPESRPSQ